MLNASLGRILSLGLWVEILFLSIIPVQAQVQTTERIGIPLYEVADLMLRPGRKFNGTIAVSGILRCSDQRTCWFEYPTNSQQHIAIDVSQISAEDKQQLRSCIALPCGELLVGLFNRAERGVYFRMLR
jgi:hypothetical protein